VERLTALPRMIFGVSSLSPVFAELDDLYSVLSIRKTSMRHLYDESKTNSVSVLRPCPGELGDVETPYI
jgi:hypothetical protein